MKISANKVEDPDVNLTPMIDVVFLLLLFFMVSTSFIKESALKVDLPEATGQHLSDEAQPVEIIINAKGQFIINDDVLDSPGPALLSERLKQAVGNQKNPHIIISADASAAYQKIVTAMDVSQQLGYTRLTLATRQSTAK